MPQKGYSRDSSRDKTPKWPMYFLLLSHFGVCGYHVIWNRCRNPKCAILKEKGIFGHFAVCITWTVSVTAFLGHSGVHLVSELSNRFLLVKNIFKSFALVHRPIRNKNRFELKWFSNRLGKKIIFELISLTGIQLLKRW